MSKLESIRKESRAAGKVKDECEAWKRNIDKLGLDDRRAFIAWLVKHFTSEQLALIHDFDWDDEGETKREYLYGVYLKSKYG
jgi:hypothetical protein